VHSQGLPPANEFAARLPSRAAASKSSLSTGLSAKAKGRLSACLGKRGRVGVLFDVISLLWSAVMASVLLRQSPGEVSKGLAIVISAGLLIYVGIPWQDRLARGASASLADVVDANG
jgi:hypothetical protein